MFAKDENGLTLTSTVADALFQNINGNGYGRDESFLATLRALLYSRVPEKESVYLQYTNSRHRKDDITGSRPRDVVRAFLRNTELIRNEHAKGYLVVHSFDAMDEDNAAAIQLLDENGLANALTGYAELKDIATFFKQNGRINVRVFLKEEDRNAVIFVDRMTIKKWHFIQSLIPRYFPWYFKDHPVTGEETALLKTLTRRYAPDYEELIEKFAERFDFRSEALKTQLKGFETQFERIKLENVRYQMENIRENINNLERQFSNLYTQLEEQKTMELGLVEKIRFGGGEESSEILDYFLCNKGLDLVFCDNGKIQFIVKTFLTNFDPEMFERAIEKSHSFFYQEYDTGRRYKNKAMTDERIKRLMIEIFRKETMKIRVCAAYELDFANGRYKGLKNYTYPVMMLNSYTPNMHIQYYGCLGNNETHIRRAVNNHDYVGAISACCASATNINFAESNTGTFFMQNILGENPGRIIQMPDGSNVTPLEAVMWLEAQDGTQKEKEEEVVVGE